VNKTDKAKVAPARPPYAPQLLRARRVLDQLRRSERSARHPKASRMTRFRTIEPVIVSVGTIALLLLGTGAVLVAWLFSA
jgi:hypothetical protein